MWDAAFSGFCPECALNGEKSRMRLNSYDFFECEKTRLQIAIPYPGFMAVVLNFRGKGELRTTIAYADEADNGEFLSPQSVARFPYCGDKIFSDEEEFRQYLTLIKA
jgi:hypothetical protein